MRRSGFTLIELVFVIVVLGILAAIAIPRLGDLQNDALVASEDAGIAAVRSGIQGLRGKIILAGNQRLDIKVVDSKGNVATAPIYPASTNYVINKYPVRLSSYLGTFPNNGTVYLYQDSTFVDGTLCAVLEPGNRQQWRTKADGNNTKIQGPATTSIEDTTAKYNTGGYWLYNPAAGTVGYTVGTY